MWCGYSMSCQINVLGAAVSKADDDVNGALEYHTTLNKTTLLYYYKTVSINRETSFLYFSGRLYIFKD